VDKFHKICKFTGWTRTKATTVLCIVSLTLKPCLRRKLWRKMPLVSCF